MKVKYINSIVFTVFLLLTSCASFVNVTSDKIDFKRYKKFAWGKEDIRFEAMVLDKEAISKLIRGSIKAEFSNADIVETTSSPDFLVTVESVVQNKTDTIRKDPSYMAPGLYPNPDGIYPTTGPYGVTPGGRNVSNIKIDQYLFETLKIGIVDASTNELLWEGVFQSRTNKTGFHKQIVRAVQSIMRKYPGLKEKDNV